MKNNISEKEYNKIIEYIKKNPIIFQLMKKIMERGNSTTDELTEELKLSIKELNKLIKSIEKLNLINIEIVCHQKFYFLTRYGRDVYKFF